jgi:glyoxylate reductase
MSSIPPVMADRPLPERIVQSLRGQVKWVEWTDCPTAIEQEVEAILTYGQPGVTGPMIDALPNLRVISNHGVGVDHIDVQAARRRGIPVGNTPGVLDGAVADLAFALLLATARRLLESIRLAADPPATASNPSQLVGQDVHGATLGIVGMGRIGREIAHRARGFRMKVVYHNRRRDETAEQDLGVAYRDLSALLEESDFVVLVVPLTDQTQGLIRAPQLLRMKQTAVLINVSRGQVVDTADLVAALVSGQIAAAGLDVTDPEPLPCDHPLLTMPNVVVTSHIGSATVQTRARMADLTIENLLLGLQGQALRCSV